MWEDDGGGRGVCLSQQTFNNEWSGGNGRGERGRRRRMGRRGSRRKRRRKTRRKSIRAAVIKDSLFISSPTPNCPPALQTALPSSPPPPSSTPHPPHPNHPPPCRSR